MGSAIKLAEGDDMVSEYDKTPPEMSERPRLGFGVHLVALVVIGIGVIGAFGWMFDGR